jgi:hypothetical protein
MRLVGLFVLALLAPAGAALAAPVQLTNAQFTAAIAGLPTQTENFEGFAAGNYASPFTLANGTYTATTPSITDSTFLCAPGSRCLIDQDSLSGTRAFSSLPANTGFWSASFQTFDRDDVFRVTVTGGSGESVFQVAGTTTFLGFSDPAGLTRIAVENLGNGGDRGNYSFDNVTTATLAALTPVPVPGSLPLVAAGLLGLWGLRRRAI